MKNKQLILLPLIYLLLCCCSITSIGYHGGVTVPAYQIIESEQSVTTTSDTSLVPVSGFFIELPRAKMSPLKIRFDCEGIWGHYSDFLTDWDYSFKGLYMNVLLKWKFSPFTSPYILSGARGGIYSNLLTQFKKDTNLENSDIVRVFDYGLVVGSGIEFDLKDLTFFFEWRYHHGLAKMKTDRFVEFRSRFHSLSLGIQFQHIMGGDD